MGKYLNVGKSGFEAVIKGQYVDKKGMILYINSALGTKDKLICMSRPRRSSVSVKPTYSASFFGASIVYSLKSVIADCVPYFLIGKIPVKYPNLLRPEK